MWSFFERFSDRRNYRIVSSVLVAGVLLPMFFLILVGRSWAWALFAFAIEVPCYVALAILTYFRLHDAGRSGWWLLPMVFAINVEPRWLLGSWGSASVTFVPSQLVSLIPVIIGWVATRPRQRPSISEA